jgi:hypothetical protein
MSKPEPPKMINSLLTLSFLKPIAIVGVLVLVLVIDFVFRRNVYNRSDPLSFSILGYSVLLVVPIVFLRILEGIKTDPTIHVEMSNIGLLIGAFVYIVLLFVVFPMATNAHKDFLLAQGKRITAYLHSLPLEAPQSGVLEALEALGKSMIEPDVFVRNRAKAIKRIEYLLLVKTSTGIEAIDPMVDQEKLLAREGRLWAQFWYVATFLFGLASTLYFYTVGH